MSNSSTTIEDLPEPLLLHILSFLCIQDAIQTSLVSWKFRNLWHSIPSLSFDIVEFFTRCPAPNPRSCRFRQLFIEFVSHTLLVRKPCPLTTFVLTFVSSNYELHETYVQNWIRKAINLSVSRLILDFRPSDRFNDLRDDRGNDSDNGSGIDSDDDSNYDSADDTDETGDEGRHYLTFHLLCIGENCVEVLKLYHCYLKLPPKTNSVKFVSLRSLELEVLELEGDDVCNLLERCVNLETLKLKEIDFEAPGGLRFYSATLKELHLEFCYGDHFDSPLDLDICCPSLQKISLIRVDVGKYTIKDTTFLVEAWVEFLSCVQPADYNNCWKKMLGYFCNISSLRVWHKLLESNEVPVGCVQYASNVKHLELYCSYKKIDLVGLAALLKLLPKLEILGLHNRSTKNAKLQQDNSHSSTIFSMPCLRKVILRKYQKTNCELQFIELFKKNAIVLEKIELLE